MKILGVGESVIDSVHIIDSRTNRPANTMPQQHIGGPILIATILLSRLGIDATFLTTLGNDKNAITIKKRLEQERVKLLYKTQTNTGTNMILVNEHDGKRQKFHNGKVSHLISKLEPLFIQQFDYILIDRHQPLAFYEILAKKKSSARIIIDPSTEISDLTYDMIRFSDYPIIPIESLLGFGQEQRLIPCLKKIYRLSQKQTIVTAGELGTITYDGKQILLYPAIRVQAVDTTGAGDIYRGAFIYGIIQNWNIGRSIQFANKIAGLQCTRLGNLTAIPTRNEIELCNHLSLTEKAITIPVVSDYFAKLYQTL